MMTENYRLEWQVEVKETYRVTLTETDLPQPVQIALSQGFDLDEIACGCTNRHLTDDGGDVLDQAFRALEQLAADHEEGPDNEEVTDRDVVAFSAVPRVVGMPAASVTPLLVPAYNSRGFWIDEHSHLL